LTRSSIPRSHKLYHLAKHAAALEERALEAIKNGETELAEVK
jgi:hypothetical protein